ncbi:T-cell surface antigen CD2-like isoform X1 [Ambystoma mexicanum]|uniref:T-cell surface antigen CD2-like isoform X1 n=1 Tax=Ambystoma mexicanum TaxID=8296 RepID=UPI0037E775A9
MPSAGALLATLCLLTLSLDEGLSAAGNTLYVPLNGSVYLNIPALQKGDVVEWKIGQTLIAKRNTDYEIKKTPGFTLLQNGTLLVERLTVQEQTFNAQVNDKGGKSKAPSSFTVIGIEALPQQAVINHTCGEDWMAITCLVGHGRVETFQVTVDGTTVSGDHNNTTFTASISIELGTEVTLTCVGTNKVSKASQEVVIACPKGLDLFLIIAIAGSGVIFIIFILLLIYCALRCCERRSIKQGDDVAIELSPKRAPVHGPRQQSLLNPRAYYVNQHEQQPQQQKKKRTKSPTSQQKLQQGQPDAQQRTARGQPMTKQRVAPEQTASQQYLATSAPQAARTHPAANRKQQPQLPPHHPSSCSHGATPRPQPRSQHKSRALHSVEQQ